MKNVQIIGHSLGAHIEGFVGKLLQEKGITLPFITALDPQTLQPSTDATWVENIHTNGGVFGKKLLKLRSY